MNCRPNRLPIGIQTFSQIIAGGYYYVDKTPFAYTLTQQDKYYFLARPRRFGKSLFLDMLKELFEGKQALFTGLAIHDQWDWSISYPVIRISFGGGDLSSIAALDQALHQQLEEHERQFDLPARYPNNDGRLRDLIARLHQKTACEVVVLVDEYDKPILDNLGQADLALAIRQRLKDFYSVLKETSAHLRFVLLTGVSKFSKVSLFSGLNNLRDITLSPTFSAICGYTDHDVDTVFAEELPGLDREQIRHWYNGYNWLGESVYNPFDLLLLFRERKFTPYWFESATPTFLVQILTERQTWLPGLGSIETDASLLSAFDVDNISTEALMFQTGYLTIAQEEQMGGQYYYQLRFPNVEVRQSLYQSLLRTWATGSATQATPRKNLAKALSNHDLASVQTLFQSFFSSIPHQWYLNNAIARYEGYYASVVFAWFVASGLDVQAEDSTSLGRIDMVVRLTGQIYLFEFKVVELCPQGAALQQIKDKHYADKYRADGVPIHLVGIEFSSATRNVTAFAWETI